MERRIGVYVCHCGANIAATVDVKKAAERAQGLDSAVVARDYEFMCSHPGQELIRNDIKELGKSNQEATKVTAASGYFSVENIEQEGEGSSSQPDDDFVPCGIGLTGGT